MKNIRELKSIIMILPETKTPTMDIISQNNYIKQ